MIFYPYGVWSQGARGGPAREHGHWNTSMVTLTEYKAQVPTQQVLHNSNRKCGRERHRWCGVSATPARARTLAPTRIMIASCASQSLLPKSPIAASPALTAR